VGLRTCEEFSKAIRDVAAKEQNADAQETMFMMASNYRTLSECAASFQRMQKKLDHELKSQVTLMLQPIQVHALVRGGLAGCGICVCAGLGQEVLADRKHMETKYGTTRKGKTYRRARLN
jgi:hypothetical protein